MAIIRGIRNHHRTCLLRSGREHDCRILDGRRTYRQVCQLSRRRSSRAKNKSSAENLHLFVSSIKEDPVKRERSLMLGEIPDKRRH
ncbi:hypothetical protein CEXT_597971 [Caerostris extrusa]|uniref:Uncharacterized protein n=1 Tax=Caerostris extrusa TaxID=172846 RepID=A0AAV4NS27_CAEEX|nr:hypothetical protein CEXT_597971 [Caerostris extrusa]